MKQKKIDFIKLLKGHRNGWVGISSDFNKVVASGKSLKEVMKKSTQKTDEKVFFFSVEENYSGFIG